MLAKISIVIPTYNNASSVAQVIKEAVKLNPYEIIVCNDGSIDETGQILKKIKYIKVISHAKNMGYGPTIAELYYRAGGEWIFSLPGDGQIPASELSKLIPYTPKYDMIIGWRKNRQDPPERLRQSWVYNRILEILFGIRVHDVNSVRFMRKAILSSVRLNSSSAFVDAELLIKAKRNGFRIIEVPIDHRADTHRGSGGQLATILSTIVDMIRFRFGL